MDPVWFGFISFLSVYVLAIVSPGPNFILVVNCALTGSRRSALFTALGVATGSGLFGLAGLAGLLVIVSSLEHFSLLVRLVGGGYLAWLGIAMVGGAIRRKTAVRNAVSAIKGKDAIKAWQTGLLTNLTNPKAWAFYFALFTVVITPGFLLWHKVLLNLSMFLISFSWYALVALAISSRRIRPHFERVQHLIQFTLGLLLVALGGRMFLMLWEPG